LSPSGEIPYSDTFHGVHKHTHAYEVVHGSCIGVEEWTRPLMDHPYVQDAIQTNQYVECFEFTCPETFPFTSTTVDDMIQHYMARHARHYDHESYMCTLCGEVCVDLSMHLREDCDDFWSPLRMACPLPGCVDRVSVRNVSYAAAVAKHIQSHHTGIDKCYPTGYVFATRNRVMTQFLEYPDQLISGPVDINGPVGNSVVMMAFAGRIERVPLRCIWSPPAHNQSEDMAIRWMIQAKRLYTKHIDTTAQSAPSFTNLPPEIIRHLFQTIPAAADRVRLATTCNTMRSVWKLDKRDAQLDVIERLVAHNVRQSNLYNTYALGSVTASKINTSRELAEALLKKYGTRTAVERAYALNRGLFFE
jgi:hypothetical protein